MKRLLPALLCALFCLPAHADTFTGRVVSIADGDTLTVLVGGREQRRVRMLGIDSPERAQAFGRNAQMALSQCAFGKEVTVEWTERDRFGRTVGKVIAAGRDCNLAQIENGFAWHFTRFAKNQTPEDRAAYANAERIAREERRGLWRDPSPEAPWEFRRREAKAAANGEPSEAEKLKRWAALAVLTTTCGILVYHRRTYSRSSVSDNERCGSPIAGSEQQGHV